MCPVRWAGFRPPAGRRSGTDDFHGVFRALLVDQIEWRKDDAAAWDRSECHPGQQERGAHEHEERPRIDGTSPMARSGRDRATGVSVGRDREPGELAPGTEGSRRAAVAAVGLARETSVVTAGRGVRPAGRARAQRHMGHRAVARSSSARIAARSSGALGASGRAGQLLWPASAGTPSRWLASDPASGDVGSRGDLRE